MPSIGRKTGHISTQEVMGTFLTSKFASKDQSTEIIIKGDVIFADDAHSEEALQRIMSSFAHACREFGLTVSLKKTIISGRLQCHGVQIDDYTLEVVEELMYFLSTISSNVARK